MLDRYVEVASKVGNVVTPLGHHWGERMDRSAPGERRDRVQYRLRWVDAVYDALVAGTATHDAEVRLVDGDRTFILDSGDEEGRRRYLIVTGWRIA